jgi:DNA-binding FadR family transcriptional regulator
MSRLARASLVQHHRLLLLQNGVGMTSVTPGHTAILKPVRRRKLSELVFDRLRAAILSGQLPPGSVLPSERKLGDSMEVNRGAVREALKRLEQSRLVSIQPGGATRVLDVRKSARLDLISEMLATREGGLDLEVARSVVELRAAISPEVVRFATQRHGAELGPTLLPLLDEMRVYAGDPTRAQALSVEFWRIVVQASDNIAFVLIFNTLDEVNARFKDRLTPLLAARYQNVASFEAMIEAIVAGNVEEARSAAERHVAQIAGILEGEIGDLQAQGAAAWRPLG